MFVACQQLLETSFPSMCESYLAGMLGPYQVEPGEGGGGGGRWRGGIRKRNRPGLRSQCGAEVILGQQQLFDVVSLCVFVCVSG